jgi:hypothetical protein
MSRTFCRLTVATLVSVGALPTAAAGQADSIPTREQGSASADARGTALAPSAAARVTGMAIGALTVAGVTQTFGTPEGWSRTWGGYARRVGDQAGFLAIEESVRLSLGRTMHWQPDLQPCGARERAAKWAHLLPRLGCAAKETMLLRTPERRARPNFPVLVGVAAAATASTTWRPDTRRASDAISFAASRTAFALGGMVISRLISDWRSDGR